jgi:hypothetical protein
MKKNAISYCSIWLTSNVIYGDIISSSPHVKEPSVTAYYEHYAHDEWSIRDLCEQFFSYIQDENI